MLASAVAFVAMSGSAAVAQTAAAIAAQVQVFPSKLLIGAVATSLPHVTSGKLKALGVTSLQRSAAAPGVPTVAESGLPGFEVVQWFGIFAPANTPREIVAKLNAEINRVLNRPDVKVEFTRQGFGVENRTPEQFVTYMKEESVKWAKLIKEAGIRAE